MSQAVRVGLVGAGFVAEIHAHAYSAAARPQAEIVAVAAAHSTSAERFAARHGIAAWYDDYRRLLDRDDIDLVDVCTPNVTHEPIVVAALAAGKHVVVEKPLTGYFGGPAAANPVGATPKAHMLAESLASADRMLDAAARSGKRLMYAENWVYCPAIRKAVELVEASRGAVLELRGEESHSGSHSSASKEWANAGGGSLIRLAAHPIGAALYVKRREGMARDGRPIRPVSVTAETALLTDVPAFRAESRRYVVSDWHDVENWSALVIAFEDGSRATMHASDVALGGIETPFEIRLSNGRIRCDMSHSGLLQAFSPEANAWGDAYLMEKVDHRGGWTHPAVDEHWMLGYPQEAQDFVAAVAEDRDPESTAELGREVVHVIYAGYLSAEQGRRVALAETGGTP